MNISTGTRRGTSLRLKLIGPFVAGALIIAGAVVYVTYTSQLRSVEEQARKQAESIISQTLATRAVYTEDVVGKLTADGIAAFPSQDFAAVSGGIPLPATLVHRISDVVNQQGLYQINLISPWAINPAKSPTAGWETDAIAQLVNDPETNQFTLETSGGESRLLYMSTDYASAETCVSCHNAHPESPKTDFKLNDMMGALVVDVPLTDQFAQARSQALVTSLGFLAALASFVVLVLWLQERSVLRPVEQLMQASRKMAQGELSTTVEVKSADEIGTLATTFNQMTSRLRETLAGLEQRVTDRTKVLATSTEISRRLSTILDQGQLVTEVVEQVQAGFNYHHAHIYLLNEAGDELVMAGGTGQAGQTLLARGHKISKGKGLVGRAAETNTSVLVSDTSKDSNWLPNPLLPETKSQVALPISIGDQVLGVLDVQQNIANSLQQEDVEAIQPITNQIAIALQNIRQFENSRKIASDLGVVANVGIATSTITESGHLLQEVVDLSKKSFDLYHAHIYLLNEAGDVLELTAGAGEVGRQMVSEKRSIPLDSEQSLVARAARTRAGVVVNDVTAAPDFLPNPLLPDTRSEMAVPLIVAGKVIGVLDVQSETANRFTDVDVSIQTTLASQVAIALQNARSLSQAQRQAERETAVNLISQQIQSATTVESVLQITARELARAVGSKQTRVILKDYGDEK